MWIPIRFRPKDKIKRVIDGREIVVFTTTTEYHGIILDDNRILAKSNKCNKEFKLKQKLVKIVGYL